MKQKKKLFLSVLICFTLLLNLFTVNVQAAVTINSSKDGTIDGYFYLFSSQGGASMTLDNGGKYSTTWNESCPDFHGGIGWNPGSDQNVIYSGTFNTTGTAFLYLNGWTRNALVEYYVVENYGNWRPVQGNLLGTVTTDGGTYDICKRVQINQPTIIGTMTFPQYWSVRTSKRSSGTITFRNHIDAWKNRGMELGNVWDFQIMATEAYNCSGTSSITVSAVPAIRATNTPTQPAVNTPTATNPGVLKGDFNNDGVINMVDVMLLAGSFNTSRGNSGYVEAYDLDGDGAINMSDVMIIASNFNKQT